jgi:5-methylcytosine-specific restriction enzyme subunit McrC
MTDDKGILIQNIYYMLAYAFQELKQNNYEDIAGEDFDNIHDLFAEILAKGISYQLIPLQTPCKLVINFI